MKSKIKRSRRYYFVMLDSAKNDLFFERSADEKEVEHYIKILSGKDRTMRLLWNGQEMADAVYDGYLTNNKIRKWLREN